MSCPSAHECKAHGEEPAKGKFVQSNWPTASPQPPATNCGHSEARDHGHKYQIKRCSGATLEPVTRIDMIGQAAAAGTNANIDQCGNIRPKWRGLVVNLLPQLQTKMGQHFKHEFQNEFPEKLQQSLNDKLHGWRQYGLALGPRARVRFDQLNQSIERRLCLRFHRGQIGRTGHLLTGEKIKLHLRLGATAAGGKLVAIG